jgi:hypothetical protein
MTLGYTRTMISAIIVSDIVVYSLVIVCYMIQYMPEPPLPPARYSPHSRGINARDVELAADALLREGHRPTIEKIREKIGRGSPNTINPLLDAWWKRLASRLDAGPAAFHRLPESVAHVAEALWMQALDEGRRRAALELRSTDRATAADRQTLEVRSHVLSLREGELESRLQDRDRTQAALESQLRELTLLLRKGDATRDAQATHISILEDQLLAWGRTTTPPARKPASLSKPKTTKKPSRATNLRRKPKSVKKKRATRTRRRR